MLYHSVLQNINVGVKTLFFREATVY